MGLKIFLFFFVIAASGCVASREELNSEDTLSVKNFISHSTICEQISFVEDNLPAVCSKKGNIELVLMSISKESKQSFSIPYFNQGVEISLSDRINDLQDQLDIIKSKVNCP